MSFHQNLYESIKNEPFKIPEDDGNDLTHTFFNPDREGWLLKLGECEQLGRHSPGRSRALGAMALGSVHLACWPGSSERGPVEWREAGDGVTGPLGKAAVGPAALRLPRAGQQERTRSR